MHVNADSLLTRSDTTSTSGTLNDLRTDLIMANNNCKVVNNLRYPDETVILKEEKEQLQELISANSFTIVFSHAKPTCNTTVHGKGLEQFQSFVYMGSLFTSVARCE